MIYDAIVVGLGAMGSATLWHLARRGKRVLGLEQYERGHNRGSSHGDSRIIREMYFEHPLYVPLVQRAHELWRELEKHTGSSLMTITGGLMIGPLDGSVVKGTLLSANQHNLPHEVLSPERVRERFPAFLLDESLVAVFDPRAGYLDADACNAAHIDSALGSRAEAHFNEPVLEWEANGEGVLVKTTRATYTASALLLTAGSWTRQLVSDLDLPLAVERQVVFWLAANERTLYDPSRFPIYAYEFKPNTICYGFPRLARGLKASVMHDGETTDDPQKVRRSISPSEIEALRQALRPVLPKLSEAPVTESETCLFTNTPDHDFLIDFHPEHPQVLISSPCSGHGFKFASALGEIQADLLINGRSTFDLSPFRLARWG
ncbi:MAG: N-methyl-L-tryptophan oxidase [Gemmatimonadaceae bacterium]